MRRSEGVFLSAAVMLLSGIPVELIATTLTSVASRRQHGAAGDFDIPVPLAGAAREPRQNGSNARVVLTFDSPPVATDGSIDCGQEVLVSPGTCNSIDVAGNDLIVKVTFPKNACVTVSATGLVGLTGDSDVTILTQEGDLNGNGAVNILDLNAAKSALNQTLTTANFKNDVNCNGSINILDLNAIKNNLNQLPSTFSLPISYGQTAQGSLTPECLTASYEFPGASGDIISFYYVGGSGVNAQSVTLRKPDGAQLAAGTGSANSWRLLDFTLPADGACRVVVQGVANATGGFSLLLFKQTVETAAINPNTQVHSEISAVGQRDEYTLDAVAGSTVTVDFSTPMVNGRSDIASRLELIRPSGTTAATSFSCTAGNRINNAAINETGTWLIRVRAYENWTSCFDPADPAVLTGAYTLAACTSATPPVAIAYGEAKTDTFAADCQTSNFDFNGAENDAATVTYLGPTQAGRLAILRADGTQLAQVNLGTAGSIDDITLPTAEPYRIVVGAANNFTGPFSVLLYKRSVHTEAITPGVATNGSISTLGEVDEWTFTANSGQKIAVSYTSPPVSGKPDLTAQVELIRPSGTVAASTQNCSTAASTGNVNATESGTWRARLQRQPTWYLCGQGLNPILLTGAYTITVTVAN